MGPGVTEEGSGSGGVVEAPSFQTTEYTLPLDTNHSRLPYVHGSFPESSTVAARIFVHKAAMQPQDNQENNNTPRMGSRKKWAKGDSVSSSSSSRLSLEDGGDLGGAIGNGYNAGDRAGNLKLPAIALKEEVAALQRTHGDLPLNSARYISNQKALLKLKGLKYEEAYKRTRPDLATEGASRFTRGSSDVELDRTLQEYRKKKTLKPLGWKGDPGDVFDLKLPCIHRIESEASSNKDSVVPDSARSTTTTCSRCGLDPNLTSPSAPVPEGGDTAVEEDNTPGKVELEKHFNEVMEGYKSNPGVQLRHKPSAKGRKLGDVVSPLRLIELLKAREPFKMENCFNYYP